MKRICVGAKVIIRNSHGSALKKGSTHTITGKERFKEMGETVWRIDNWLFRTSHLELNKEG